MLSRVQLGRVRHGASSVVLGGRARFNLSKSKYMELVGLIDQAWRKVGKPAIAPSALFTQVTAGYSRDTITRVDRRLGVRTETTNDPVSGFLI